MAVNKGDGLILMACEKCVFGELEGKLPACPVPADMVAPWNAAREASNELVCQQEAVSGKHMLDILTKKERMLEQIDRSFKIELAFLAALADAGGIQGQKMMLASLGAHTHTPASTTLKLNMQYLTCCKNLCAKQAYDQNPSMNIYCCTMLAHCTHTHPSYNPSHAWCHFIQLNSI